MSNEPKSIADEIRCLARSTGAPESFVDQVKQLFSSKGISLHDDATPFVTALHEAFRREQTIRCSTLRAKESLARLRANFDRIGKVYADQLSRVRQSKNSPGTQKPRRPGGSSQASPRTVIAIRGDHRTLITRVEREELPMVPGPTELQ